MMALLFAAVISDSTSASVHTVSGGIITLGDAAIRALLVACAVGAGLRLLAPRHVPAQKTAWGLVLAGALLMPVLAPWAGKATWLPSEATFVVPAHTWSQYIRSKVDAFSPVTAPVETLHATPVAIPATETEANLAPAISAPLERKDVSPVVTPADRFPAPTISHSQTGGAEPSAARSLGTRYYLPISDFIWLIYGSVTLALLLRLFY